MPPPPVDATVADFGGTRHAAARDPADVERIARLEAELRRRDQALISAAARMAAQDRRIRSIEQAMGGARATETVARETLPEAERDVLRRRSVPPVGEVADRPDDTAADDDTDTASDGPWEDDGDTHGSDSTATADAPEIRFPQAAGLRPEGVGERVPLGVRWSARDTASRRPVSVLVFARPLNEAGSRRLGNLPLVRHESLAHVLATGTTPTGPYVVFERVEGETLAAWVDRVGPLPEETARSVALQIARGLREAAFHGAVHGDLSPHAVRVDRAGRARVLDVGVGALYPMTDRPVLAPPYAAPERLRGSPPPDVRSDVYSLGAVLHFLLVGTPPYEGDRAQVVRSHAVKGPPDPGAERPDVAPAAAKLILKFTARNPTARPATWDEVLVDLELRAPQTRDDARVPGLRGKLARLVKRAARRGAAG